MKKYLTKPLYLAKWTVICFLVGLLAGTASVAFLFSLDIVTAFRNAHLWIVIFFPLAGFIMSLLYLKLGQNIEGENNLLIKTIQKPEGRIPFRMVPFIFLSTVATHLFGGSAGREGTGLQMGGAVFSLTRRLRGEER